MSGPYRVVFRGKIVDESSLQAVKERFIDRFNVSPDRIEFLFSGTPVTLKRDLTLEQARLIQQKVRAAGGLADIEGGQEAQPPPKRWTPSSESTPQPVPVQPAPPSGPAAATGDPDASPAPYRSWSESDTIELAQTESAEYPGADEARQLPNVFDGQTRHFQETRAAKRQTEKTRVPSSRAFHLGCLVMVVAAVAFLAYRSYQNRGIEHGPGVLAPHDPIQKNLPIKDPFAHNGFNIIPKAHFQLTARVLSVKHYRSGPESKLSPTDLAMGWGRMSDEAILKDIKITQSGRFYFWRVKSFPIPRKEIETHSANMHMIPATDDIRKQLKTVRKGHIVSLTGKLIDVRRDDGWHWHSSMTRNDTGMGACEVIWVESFQVK